MLISIVLLKFESSVKLNRIRGRLHFEENEKWNYQEAK